MSILIAKIKEASESGSDLIVLQELHQSEYFCQSVDTKYFKYAESFEDDVRFWQEFQK